MYCDGRSTGILNKPFGKRSYPSWRQWGSSIYIGWNSGSICGISVGSLGLPTMGEFESYSCRRHWKKIAWKMQRNAALVFPALGWEATKRMFMDCVVLLCEPRTCWSLGTSTMSPGNAINKYLFFFFFPNVWQTVLLQVCLRWLNWGLACSGPCVWVTMGNNGLRTTSTSWVDWWRGRRPLPLVLESAWGDKMTVKMCLLYV